MMLPQDMLGGSYMNLPIDGLPYEVQDIIITIAKALNCPMEFVVASAMQAAAQAAGDRFMWSDGVHEDYPQFYMALVGSSTEGKSHAIRKMFKPLEDADNISLEQRREAIVGKSKEERAKVPYNTNILQDVTTEAYQNALMFNSGGVTLVCDELLSLFGSMNRYRKGNDEKFYLSAFANYAPFKIARKGEGIEIIAHPIVRTIGGIQPEVMAGNFSGSEMLSDGMFQRIIWFLKPEAYQKAYVGAKTDTGNAESLWRQYLFRILDRKQPVRVMFDANSEALHIDFINDHIRGYNAGSLFGYELAVWGKLEIYAIMWAMTTAILRYAVQGDTSDELVICKAEMEYALRCMNYFRQTAMRVYDIITEDSANSISKKEWIRVGWQNGFYTNQSQLAELLGVSQPYINQIVTGKK